MTSKKTLVLGASENTSRYSNLAVNQLIKHGHEVIAIGHKSGNIGSVPIVTDQKPISDLDTVTLYLNAHNQEAYYEYILGLKPKRLIFNPGAENDVLKALAEKEGIACMEACSLVLLSTGQY